ncbi:hypothetical protein GCM10027347_59720 [Larkinella harenae]
MSKSRWTKKPSESQQQAAPEPKRTPVFNKNCQVCGNPRAAWGFGKKGEVTKWYCYEHREIGHKEYFG